MMFCAMNTARGEAMLQLFNVNWNDLADKMPEIAEAGYTSLWLPPPAKAGSVFSVGYDPFDPFDLGDKNQRGTVRTRYGTKQELLHLVEMAHRFGLRVYFDNIMNHRGFDTPGYTASTPTNLYPGMTVQDFHVRRQGDGTYRNWDSSIDYGNVFQIQNRPLSGLIDIANEPGGLNLNHGATEGSTTPKVAYVRQPANPEYYMDQALPAIAGSWRPFNGAQGDPVAEDVNAYLIRAAMWTLHETKCDGFRLDAVKHTPSTFFGDAVNASPNGYTGGIQTMYDAVHGFGNNAGGNGFIEADDNRNSCYDAEAIRNDALLFGEHLGAPPSYQEYLDRGMRLLSVPLHSHFNNVLGNPGASLGGLDQRDPSMLPFSPRFSVLFAQSHDDAFANRRELHNAYNFFHEGIPVIYSDGYNHSSPPDFFPRIANAPYLGQFGDPKMPDLAHLHHQLARGGTRPRWSDADVVAFERYDYREPGTAADQTVVLFAMNDNYAGAVSFDDGHAQQAEGTFYECFPVSNSRGVGLAVGFPPGTVLAQLAESPNRGNACSKLLVRHATASASEAADSVSAPEPVNRRIYVGGQSIPPGGGAIELKIPQGSYVAYGIQWPEPSRATGGPAISIHQQGAAAPRLTIHRRDGVNGDSAFAPQYPFRVRGSINAMGEVESGTNVSNRTYAIDVPVVTNSALDLIVRADASANNILVKIDGGMDLNSHLGIGPTDSFDRRDNPAGSATDLLMGYEQAEFRSRFGPERFAAAATSRNNIISPGAETYAYSVGAGSNGLVNGIGYGAAISEGTAAWTTHDPTNTTSILGVSPTTQRFPLQPNAGQPVDLYVRAGYEFLVNRCVVYYTTNGTVPEGSFGIGRPGTHVAMAEWVDDDWTDGTIDWWKATIPAHAQVDGTQVRYKVALFREGIAPMAGSSPAKVYGLTTFVITNFSPASARVWLHNNRNTNHTAAGLAEGFHIVRARAFLERDGKSSVFNTFAQTFYYDAVPPDGVIAFPPANGSTLNSASYEIVIRADSSVEGVEVNIADSNPANDDAVTGGTNGNGSMNGAPVFVPAAEVTPQNSLNVQHPTLPREFRFNYSSIPSGGAATITVRLKEATTAILPDRIRTLSRTVNTAAPSRVLFIHTPATNGPLPFASTNAALTIRACNTTAADGTANANNYSLRINGGLIPSSALTLSLSPACGTGFHSIAYRWTNVPAGPNEIQLTFNGSVVLTDTRTIFVTYPGSADVDSDGDGMSDLAEQVAGTDPHDASSVLRITELADGNRAVVWESVPGLTYQVLATTNLAAPPQPISPLIQASENLTAYYDQMSVVEQKFYRIQVVP